MKTIGVIVVTALFIALSTLWSGFVFAKLWLWFIAATFDVKSLTTAQAIGVMFVWYAMRAKPTKEDKRPFWEQMVSVFAFAFLHWLFALAFGAVWHALLF